MKNIFMMVMLVMTTITIANAQSSSELRKEAAKERREALKDLNKERATKDAKKRAKKLTKDGWTVVGSGKAIEKQITDDQIRASELMRDETGAIVTRYFQHDAIGVQNSLNAAETQARLACQTEIASQIETKLAGAMEQKMDGAQTSAITAQTVDKFHQRFKGIVDGCLNNMIQGLTIYRVLPNNNYQVQVTYSVDKKELAAQLKRKIQKELEMEGDEELNGLVDDTIKKW